MRRSIILLLLLPLFLMLSCQLDRPHKDVLEKEELVPLLMDLHMLYAIQSSVDYRKIASEYDSVDTYTYIFDKHGVSRAVFDSSIAWYSRHPKRFTEIYDEVVMNLTQIQDSIEVNQME